MVAEGGGWSVLIPGLPVAADGNTFAEAIDEMIDALREYADDWQDHLLDAPNHVQNWGLVQLISLSDDDQLRAAMALLFREMKLAVEPAAAAATAALVGPLRERLAGKKVGVLVCGSNIDFDTFERHMRQVPAANSP